MSKFKVEVINDDPETWEKFISECPESTIFHSISWLKVLDEIAEENLILLGCYHGKELVSAFPIFLKKEKRIRTVLSPLPRVFTYYGGPLFKISGKRQSKREFIYFNSIKSYHDYLIQSKINNFNLKTYPGFQDPRMFQWLNFAVLPKYTYVINLRKNEKEMWQSLDTNTRRIIRKGLSTENIILEELSPNDNSIDVFWEIFEESHERKYIKVPFIKNELKKVFNSLHPENLEIICGRMNDNIGAFEINLKYGKKLYGWLAASKTDLLGYNLPDLLCWETILRGINSGYHSLEFIGANVKSVAKFKCKYNPNLSIYYEISKTDLETHKLIDRLSQILKNKINLF